MAWLIGIAVLVLIVVIIVYQYKKRLDSSWKGTLADKQVIVNQNTSRDANGMSMDTTYNTYQLKFKTETGEVKMNVNEKLYNQFNVGEKFEKVKGESNPRKV